MQITAELVVFILTILVGAFGAWWRIEARVKQAETSLETKVAVAHAQAALATSQLSEYKTHVAETYITKAGMREMRDEIMTGVRELKGSVSTIHERIDQIILAERQPGNRSARSPP